MDRLETNGYYALGVPLYLALVGLELVWTRRRGLSAYGFADTLGNISAGMGEIILGLFLGPYLLALYDFAYARWALFHWPEGSPWVWVAAFLLADLGYYWYHRAGHRVGVLWAIHGVHHQCEHLNISVALRHPWLSDVYSAPFYVLLPLCGVPAWHFFLAISIISFYSLSVHSLVFQRPTFWVLVSPATHIVHHAKNPRYLGKNLGAMFTLWDRLFGTHEALRADDPPRLGTPAGYQTHSGARAQWLGWRDLWLVSRAAPSWQEALKVWLGPPGYRPPGVPAPKREAARPDSEIAPGLKWYALAQLSLLAWFSIFLLWRRSEHPFWFWVAGAALVLYGLFALGELLDGAPAAAWEARIFSLLCAGLGAGLLLAPRYAEVGALLLLWALGALAGAGGRRWAARAGALGRS